MNLFLPIYYIIYLLLVVLWRVLSVKKSTGINAFSLLAKTGPQGVIVRHFKVAPFISAFVLIIYTCFNNLYPYLSPFKWLETPLTFFIGAALLLLSLVWIVIAQIQMGQSWRIGIDTTSKTELKKHGLFSISRNPIFFGVKITMIGFFFVLPNAITLMLMVLDYTLINIQVALEEEYLLSVHGESYHDYCTSVRRWI